MLVLTSLSPVLITYAFILFLENESWKKISIVLLAITVLVLLCTLILRICKRRMEVINFPIESIKTADSELIGFFIAYLMPFVTFSSDEHSEVILIFIICLFILIIWGTHSYHTNPLLTIMGYHFYEVTTPQNVSYLLVTKRDLRNTKSIKKVVQISDYMVLDVTKTERNE